MASVGGKRPFDPNIMTFDEIAYTHRKIQNGAVALAKSDSTVLFFIIKNTFKLYFYNFVSMLHIKVPRHSLQSYHLMK